MPILGFKELQRDLKMMGAANGGKALRSAAMRATLPTVKRARLNAPKGNPPYNYSYGTFDPYPRKTHKGRLVTPGFTSRSIARKSKISKDKRTVRVWIGVRPEAFAALQFIELGTSTIRKQPWLEPSFKESISDLNSTFRKVLKQNIDKAIGS